MEVCSPSFMLLVEVNSRCPPHPSLSYSNKWLQNESENNTRSFHTTPKSQKMSSAKVAFLILLWQTSFLHNEAALVVFAPSSHRVQLGENFVLPCSFKVDDPSINLQYLAILWLFRGNEVLRIDNKGTTSQSRMFINQHGITKGNANMEIKNVTISDIGKYRCMVIYSPQKEFKDIDLNVYATPSVMVEKVEKEDKTSVALCSVTGFYPSDITVEILQDRTIMEDSVLSAYHTNADGTYSVNRTWKIPTDVSPKMLSCSVRHETLSPSVQKDLQVVYQGGSDNTGVVVGCIVGVIILIVVGLLILWYCKRKPGHRFMVKDIESPGWIDGEKTALCCEAFHCTEDVKVTWVIKLRDGTQHEVSDTGLSDKEEEQPLMSREYQVTKEHDSQKMKGHVTTKLTFIPSISRHLGSSVSCKIVHQKKPVEKTFEVKSIYAKPTFVEPVQFTLSDQGDVKISVKLQKFYPQEMEVGWFFKREQSEEKMLSEVIKSNSGDKFDLESKCSVSGELLKDPSFKVIVRWKHLSMEKPQSREMSIRDLPWHPKLQKFPIESVFQGDEVLLQCRVSDYFPDALAVKWFERKMGNQDLEEISSSQKYKIPEISSCRMENQTFSSTAVLSYKRSDLSEKGVEFICRAEHPSLDTPIQTSIVQYRDAEAPTFVLNNIQGPQTWLSGEKVTLYCTASYCKEGTQVIWMVKSSGVTISEISEDGANVNRDSHRSSGYVAHRERTEKSDKEGLQDVTSSLTFTPSISTHQNLSIACKILCDGKIKEKTFQHKYLYAKPTASGPIKLSLTDSGEVLCSLDIEGFYPNDIQMKWNDKKTSEPNRTSQNSDGTYSVHSDYTLPGSFFTHPNSTVKVSWKHDSMEDWESRELSVRDKDFPWKANVQDIPVPNLLIGRAAVLKCEVSNVFPDVLTVKWLKKEKDGQDLFPVIHSQTYNISELRPEKQKDKTFTYKLCLKLKPSISTEEGAEFICRVEHPTLEVLAEKSTGPLTIKGFPKVKDIACVGEDIYSLEVDGFYPQKLTVSWRLCGQSSTVENDPVTSHITYKTNDDGSFKATSTCDLRKAKNNLDKWTDLEAIVEHETLDNPIYKREGRKIATSLSQDEHQDSSPRIAQEVSVADSIPALPPTDTTKVPSPQENSQQNDSQIPQDKSQTDSAVQPKDENRIIVGEIQGPRRWIHREKVALYCSVSDCSEDTRVMWMVEQTDGRVEEISNTGRDSLTDSGYMISKETEKSDKEGLFNITSLLTLLPSVSKHLGVIFTFQITSDGQTKTKKFQAKSIYAKPQLVEPVKTSLCDNGDVLCSLNLQNFYPKHLKLIWRSGEDQLKSKEEFEKKKNHTYNVCSHCTVPGKLLLDPNFTLHVTWSHKSLEKEQSQVLSWRRPGLSWCPVIEEVPIPHILTERQNTLQYNISGYFPDEVTVIWYRKEKGAQEYVPLSQDKKYQIPDIQSQRQSDLTYSCTARLLFIPTVTDGESEIMCRVSHPSLERPIERGSGPLQVQAKPKARKPIKASLGTGEVIFFYTLENFYPKHIQVDWCYWSGEKLEERCPSKEKYKDNLTKTFSVSSRCTIPENLLHHPDFRVRFTWRLESMDEKEYKEFSIRDKDFPWRPQVEMSVPPLRSSEEATIQCTVTKYFPNAVNVLWFRKHTQSREMCPVSSDGIYRIMNISLERQNDKSYGCRSCVTFYPSLERDQGVEYICRVEHPSLEQPIEKSTGALQVTAPEQQEPCIQHPQLHSGVPAPVSHHPSPQDVSDIMDHQNHPSVPAPVSRNPSPQDVSDIVDHQNHPSVPAPVSRNPSLQDVSDIVDHQNHPSVPAPVSRNPFPQDVSDIMDHQHHPGVPAPVSRNPSLQDLSDTMDYQNYPGVPAPESHHPTPQDVSNTMDHQHHPGVPAPESHHPTPQDVSNTMDHQHHPGVSAPEPHQHHPSVPAPESHHPTPQHMNNMMIYHNQPSVPAPAPHHPMPHDVSNLMGHPNHNGAQAPESQHSPQQVVYNRMDHQHQTGAPPLGPPHHPPQEVYNIMYQQNHPGVPASESQHLYPQDVYNMTGHPHYPSGPAPESLHPHLEYINKIVGPQITPISQQHCSPPPCDEDKEMEVQDMFSQHNVVEHREESEPFHYPFPESDAMDF
ncbi:uncharacterized protein LOC120943117 [Rana temporaria]|uniref:uncharacterized protein LOC120943117 n=1 Tax=Rana temporaria TaxID=8407 RepID=UPI001AACE445|nr:uncharacterized protein LOC120943117 [Rana temporaria]